MQYNSQKARSALVWIAAHLESQAPALIWPILYLAERRCLSLTGRGILGDVFVAMKSGPVPLYTYMDVRAHCPKCTRPGFGDDFGSYLRHGRYRFGTEDAIAWFSVEERECLSYAIGAYRELDVHQLARSVCGFAWQRADACDEMSPLEIAREGGADAAVLDFILRGAELPP